MIARAAIRAVALSLLSLPVLLGLQGCSLVTMGYGHLDTFTLYLVRDYIQPEPGVQYNEARSAVQRLHQWHRQRELPAYAALATEAAQRLERPLTPEDLRWVWAQFRQRYQSLVRQAVREAVPTLVQLGPDQLARLEHRLAEENEKFAREFLYGDAALQRRVYSERLQSQIDDWVGSLDRAQIAIIDRFVHAHQPYLRLRFEDRQRRQREALVLIRRERNPAELLLPLATLLADQDSGRSEEMRTAARRWEDGIGQMYLELERSMTREQRQRAQTRLRRFADDFNRLVNER
jgi:hypothetical protein